MTYRFHTLAAALAFAAVMPGIASCAPKPSTSAASKLAALKELRDTGVITPEQYQAQAATLGVPAQAVPPVGDGGKEEHVVEDPQLGMAAFKVGAPRGWRVQGRTSHDAGCSTPQDYEEWSADSPDGLEGVSFSAGVKYGAVNAPPQMGQLQQQMQSKGCIIFASTDAGQVLQQAYLPQAFPGSRIVSVTAIPASDPMRREMQKMNDATQAQIAQTQTMQTQLTLSGATARVAYQQAGQALEAEVKSFAICSHSRTQLVGAPPMETLDCTLGPIMAIHAPAGRLDQLAAQPNLVSSVDNPAHAQRVAQIRAQQSQQQMQQTAAQGQAQRDAIVAQGQANVAAIQRRGASIIAQGQARSQAFDQSNQAFNRYLSGQAQYSDTNGQTFNASNQYNHTYVDGNGHVVQSNSAYGPGPGWTETQGR